MWMYTKAQWPKANDCLLSIGKLSVMEVVIRDCIRVLKNHEWISELFGDVGKQKFGGSE